jgi:hypothetical protein
VIVGGKGAGGFGAELPVEPDGGGQGQQPLRHPGMDPWAGPAAVALQAELVFEHTDDRLDPLPNRSQAAEPVGLVAAVGALKVGAEGVDLRLEQLAGNALVADDDQPGKVEAVGPTASSASATSRSPRVGLARHQATATPSTVHSKYSFRPQYQREWLAQEP